MLLKSSLHVPVVMFNETVIVYLVSFTSCVLTLCQVPEMLEVLHNRLQVIGEEQVKVAIGQSILILATQHLRTVVNTLIAYPLPYDR